MNQICSYCGQNTFNVDWDYLVGHNHLSCVLTAEKKAEKMQIVNWKKLTGEKLSIAGADLYFMNCEENTNEYKAEIGNNLYRNAAFLLRLKKLPGMYDLEIEYNELNYPSMPSTKIKRLIRTNDLKSPATFIIAIQNEMLKNSIYKSLCVSIGELQKAEYEQKKLKPVTGNVNFNMPISKTIK